MLLNRIKEIIKEELLEAQQNLVGNQNSKKNDTEEKLKSIVLQIFFGKHQDVSDIITNIRIVTGVNTVYQYGSSTKSKLGNKVVVLKVTYNTSSMPNDEYIKQMLEKVNLIKGINYAKILKLKKSFRAAEEPEQKKVENPLPVPSKNI